MNYSMAGKCILLVEDNPDEVLLAKRAIDYCKGTARLVVASNGQEALDVLFSADGPGGQYSDKIISIVLLDLNLPMIGGLEVLRQIRASSSTYKIPVIVLSSSMDERDYDECRKLGASEYISKPISFSEFVKVMRDVMSRWLESDGQSCNA